MKAFSIGFALVLLIGVAGCGGTKLSKSVVRIKVEEAFRDTENMPGINPFPCEGIYLELTEVTVKETWPDYTGVVHVKVNCFGEEHEGDLDFKMSPVKPPPGIRLAFSASDPSRWKLISLMPHSGEPDVSSYETPSEPPSEPSGFPRVDTGGGGRSQRQADMMRDARGVR